MDLPHVLSYTVPHRYVQLICHENESKDRRDGSSGGSELQSQSPRGIYSGSYSSPRGCGTLFSPPRVPGRHTYTCMSAHTYTRMPTHTYTNTCLFMNLLDWETVTKEGIQRRNETHTLWWFWQQGNENFKNNNRALAHLIHVGKGSKCLLMSNRQKIITYFEVFL